MKFKRILIVITLALFLTSCAYHHEIVRTPDIPLYNQTVMLNNIQYIPLLKYCEYYNLDWDWDLVSQKIKIKKNQNTMVLRPNSEYALFNNRTVALDYPVEYKNGAAYIPITTAVFMSKEVFDLKDKPVLPIKGHRIRTVVLDPGHGGKDPGAISRYGTREKDIVLDVARRLKRDLERNGLEVFIFSIASLLAFSILLFIGLAVFFHTPLQ